jgi:hypothetical protein
MSYGIHIIGSAQGTFLVGVFTSAFELYLAAAPRTRAVTEVWWIGVMPVRQDSLQ